MKNIVIRWVLPSSILLSILLGACQSPLSKSNVASSYRRPASSEELITGSQKLLRDVSDPQIFNSQTCSEFVGKVTDYLFYLPADHFIPKGPVEVKRLKMAGGEVMDTIFQIRVVLHEKLQQFDARKELSKDCIQKIREGFQYARFAEEYLLEWLYSQEVYSYQFEPILANSKPSTWTNPKYSGFQLKSGDVMLIRGKSYVSAMIARIGDEEGSFSHLAIVGEDGKGEKYVVESLIQLGVIVTPLEQWRQQADARVALYRQPNSELGRQAARKIFDRAQSALNSKQKGIPYDFAMDDSDYSAIFCSEVIRFAYDLASDGGFLVPKYRSTVSKFKNSEYPRSLGVKKDSLFAPYDIEVDPRFDLVAEYRYYPLLRQVRMQDAVLQSIYSWMIEKNYDFHFAPGHSLKAYFAKFIRQFGLAKDVLPPYMPMESLKTTVQFEAVAKVLEENIYKREAEFYQAKGYLPSFQDLMAINENLRLEDCQVQKQLTDAPTDPSRFHWFFYRNKKACD